MTAWTRVVDRGRKGVVLRVFRVLFLDGCGRVVDFQEMQFSNDEEAMAQVRARRHRRPVEVWQGGRLIGRVEPEDGREQDP